MSDEPLLSFVLTSYNHEAFIREAVAGALAQTYSPLEIIFMDDCSKDRTFDIIQEMVAAYRGPHTVRANRNETNLGIAGNVNRAMTLCRGELILVAAGDDVSVATRTEVTFRAWEQFGRRPTSICSSYLTISESGAELGPGGFRGDPNDTREFTILNGDLLRFLSTRQPAVCGCSHAWMPALFDYFGPLKSGLEDLVLSFRSHAIGQILYIRQPLVKYRRHGANVSFFAGGDDSPSFAHREARLRWVDDQTIHAYENMLADIEILSGRGRLAAGERERLKQEGERIRTIYAVERQLLDGSMLRRLTTLLRAAGQGHVKCALRFSPRLLPRAIYRWLYTFKTGGRASRDVIAGQAQSRA